MGGYHQMARRTTVAGLLMLSAALAGCISGPQQDSMLTAAGFVRREADSLVKLAKLEALPQRTVVATQRKSGVFYIYADAMGCGCIYVGDQAAHQQYQQMQVANNIAQKQETTAVLGRGGLGRLWRRLGTAGARLVGGQDPSRR